MHWIASLEKDGVAGTLETRLWDAADQFRARPSINVRQHVLVGHLVGVEEGDLVHGAIGAALRR
jgi:hypothetical protein